jgi:RimJ/RimL family protein N-acetyltransferase
MNLRPFNKTDYPLLLGWIPDADFALLWGGPRYHWPLDSQQIDTYLQNEPVSAYLFIDDERPIGYIELAQDPDNQIRLCRILIADPNARSKGYGSKLISLAIEKAKVEFGAVTVELAVFENNQPARRCYEKLGFVVYQQGTLIEHKGESWPLLRMKMRLD